MLSFLSPQRVESNFLRGFCNRGNVFQSTGGSAASNFIFLNKSKRLENQSETFVLYVLRI